MVNAELKVERKSNERKMGNGRVPQVMGTECRRHVEVGIDGIVGSLGKILVGKRIAFVTRPMRKIWDSIYFGK